MSKINEYPQAATINNNDLFVIDQESGGDHATKSASVSQIADKATSGVQSQIGSLSTLTTTDKSSIVGAVNEVNNSLTNYSTSTATDIFATYQGTMIRDVAVTQTHKVTSMVLRGTIPAGSWQTVGTVKDRFKNSIPIQSFAVIDTTANYVGMMYLGTDGTVNFFLQGSGNKNVDFGFTYIAQ